MTVTEEQTFEACDLPCKSVTVYTDRAEVKRLVQTTLKSGSNEVIVKKLPKKIDKESVRVDGRGKATICEVQYLEKHIKKDEEIQAKQKELSDKLKELQKKRRELDDDSNVLQRKKEVLDGVANQVSNGVKSGSEKSETKAIFSLGDDSMESLDKFINFYSDKLSSLAGKFRDLDKEKNDLEEEIRVTQRNLAELQGVSFGQNDTYLSREVSIILESEGGGEVELDVSYVVSGASWAPSYDFRVFTGDTKTMKVLYHGQISQNTGEDWTDTELSLSTAMPSIGGAVPELKTLKALLYKPPPPKISHQRQMFDQKEVTSLLKQNIDKVLERGEQLESMCYRSSSITSDISEEEVGSIAVAAVDQSQKHEDPPPMPMPQAAPMMMARSNALFGSSATESTIESVGFGFNAAAPPSLFQATVFDVKESVICTSFRIARSTTIPSDNTSHKVNVAVVDLEPEFEHETVPSKSQYAFLKAKVTNTSQYPFLAGPVSVFLDNNFIAKSSLKAVSPNEEFSCSLGADPAVRVEYKPVRVFHEQTGVWSKSSVEIHDQRISVKNTHKDEVRLRILEQVPLSTDEKLKVTLIKPEIPKDHDQKKKSEYRLNKDNVLEWDVKMTPGLQMEFEIKWTLEYPRNETIELKEEH